ncbi:MAG: uracil DNA glycosylase [Pleopsidium flavum]|nr:MAG: uracil DNA glycosylase [Pleopsidium flavum]
MAATSPLASKTSTSHPLSFPPSHVLRAVATSMNWRDRDIVVNVEREMTWRSATAAVLDALGDRDGPVHISAPRLRGAKEYIKRLALEQVTPSGSGNIHGLPLRNAPDLASLPHPKPTSMSARAKLKEDLRREPIPDREPYLLRITATAEDRWLPSIPGTIEISGVDSVPDDPQITLSRSDILIDTGAHVSTITDDLLDDTFREYLSDSIHDPYRSSTGVTVQLAGVFAFGDQPALEMDCIFQVVPLDSVPNQRSGIILGQNSVIDSIEYSSRPRKTLIARGEKVLDTVWGDIVVDGYVNVDGDYVTI